MKNRNILNIILLLGVFVLSCEFIFSKRLLWFYEYNNIICLYLLPILLAINVYLLKRKKRGKLIYLFSVITGIILLSEVINLLRGYFEFNGWACLEYFYLAIITYALVNGILNFKNENSLTNDLLMCLVSFFAIVIHIRYYVDKSFLHNLLNFTDTNNIVLQNSYAYVTGNYGYFILMYLVILINREIYWIKR